MTYQTYLQAKKVQAPKLLPVSISAALCAAFLFITAVFSEYSPRINVSLDSSESIITLKRNSATEQLEVSGGSAGIHQSAPKVSTPDELTLQSIAVKQPEQLMTMPSESHMPKEGTIQKKNNSASASTIFLPITETDHDTADADAEKDESPVAEDKNPETATTDSTTPSPSSSDDTTEANRENVDQLSSDS